MKGGVVFFNLILLALVFLAGCGSFPGSSSNPKIRMAFFVEQEPHRGEPVVDMKILRSNPRTVTVAARPVLELGKGTLDAAVLREGTDGVLIFELYFTSQGALLFQELTSRYKQQRLYVVVAQPGEEKKLESRCLGVWFVQDATNVRVIQFTPDAEQEEAIAMVEGINKEVR